MIPDYNTYSRHWQSVAAFKRGSGKPVPESPTEPDEASRVLYAKLLLEETLETIEALGVNVSMECDGKSPRLEINELEFKPSSLWHGQNGFDMAEVVDGVIDVKYVGTFILVSCGVPDVPFVEMVDENNLAKLGPGSWKDAEGKVRKPPGHPRPPIAEKLAELGWKGAAS